MPAVTKSHLPWDSRTLFPGCGTGELRAGLCPSALPTSAWSWVSPRRACPRRSPSRLGSADRRRSRTGGSSARAWTRAATTTSISVMRPRSSSPGERSRGSAWTHRPDVQPYIPEHFDWPEPGSARAAAASARDRRLGARRAVRRLSAGPDGYRPLILERGRAVKDRVADVRRFDEDGPLDPESNYLFGEGGAGTFSDGKLTSRGTGPDVPRVLEILADCHGKPSIVYEHRPHLGSNRLPLVVRTLRRKFEELGGEIRFSCRVEDLDIADGRLARPVDVLGLHRRRPGDAGDRPQRPRHLRHAAPPRRADRGQAVPARRPDRTAAGGDRPRAIRPQRRPSRPRRGRVQRVGARRQPRPLHLLHVRRAAT